jgi:glycerol-3-phosphate dehydrogenase (NAD(P)+)
MRFVICGAGAWGTAVAVHLARKEHEVILVPRSEEKAEMMRRNGENCFHLPRVPFPTNLRVDAKVEDYLNDCYGLFFACPIQGLRTLCEGLVPHLTGTGTPWLISLIKGLEQGTLRKPSAIVADYFPQWPFACLSGPTYALEFALGQPAAMVLASPREDLALLQRVLDTEEVRVQASQDLSGVELASCLKNIYALGAGLFDGLGLGDNAKAAYLTGAVREMAQLGCLLGGQRETFYGLSGLGDLMATAQGQWSRNRTFGERFARGVPLEELTKGLLVEGYWSLDCFRRLATQMGAEMPILCGLHAIVYQHLPLEAALRKLLL